MVNGRKLEEELNSIEKFFQEMSIEDFDEMLMNCGINDIRESYQSNYVLACESLLFSEQRYVNHEPVSRYFTDFNKIDNRYDVDLEVA